MGWTSMTMLILKVGYMAQNSFHQFPNVYMYNLYIYTINFFTLENQGFEPDEAIESNDHQLPEKNSGKHF